MEPIPTGDPGLGNRPLGALALITTAVFYFTTRYLAILISCLGQVERAHKMYITGDFIASAQHFGADFCGPTTTRYMDYIANDLSEKHWGTIFDAFSSFSTRKEKEEAVIYSAPEESHERIPLPPSDPPSPPRDG